MASLVEPLSELFGYNRGNFMFDRKLRQEREYMEQDMRVKQFLMYREDVRDLSDLTVSKMDSYIMIALLELGCCLDLLVEGVMKGPAPDKQPPSWLLWLFIVTLAEAMLYLFLSTWLAIHASVSCHSFSVRLLTQYVRLPVPNQRQLDAASSRGQDFEGKGGALFRVPVWQQQLQRLGGAEPAGPAASQMPASSAAGMIQLAQANSTVATEHVNVYRTLQANWQAHDAYARACLCIGSYAFLHAVAYYTVGLFVVELGIPWAAMTCTMSLTALTWMVMRLDLYFKSYLHVAVTLLLVTGPVMACVAATMQFNQEMFEGSTKVYHVFLPIIFFLHILLIIGITVVARGEHTGTLALPTRFRSVLFLDVFGWLDAPGQATAPSRAQQQTARMDTLPPQVREALVSQSSLLDKMLRLEINGWLGQANAENLAKMPHLKGELEALRAEYNRVTESFAHLVGHRSSAGGTSAASSQYAGGGAGANSTAGATPDIYLRIVWTDPATGSDISYFTRPGTGEAKFEEPEEGALVSDIDGMRARLSTLRERVTALTVAAPPPPPPASAAAASSPHQPPVGEFTVMNSAPAVPSTLSSRIARTFRSGEVRGQLEVPEMPPLSPATSATQELRFGGREAVRVEDIHVQRHAQSFHPRQDGRRESTRPPGQVPWTTYKTTSAVLVAVWALGVFYHLIFPLWTGQWEDDTMQGGRTPGWVDNGLDDSDDSREQYDGPRQYEDAPVISAVLVHFRRGDWPWRPVARSFVSMACHPQYGKGKRSVLVAEPFSVHVLEGGASIKAGASIADQKDIEACLATENALKAIGSGITAVRIQCGRLEAGKCEALLVLDGRYVLTCPLDGTLAQTGNHGEDAEEPIGCLEDLSSGRNLLITDSRGSPVQWMFLNDERGKHHELLAQVDVATRGESVACSPGQRAALKKENAHQDRKTNANVDDDSATVSSQDKIAAVTTTGELGVWQVQAGGKRHHTAEFYKKGRWQLPGDPDHRWVDACILQENVFALNALGDVRIFPLDDKISPLDVTISAD